MVDLNMLLTETIAWNTGFWGTIIGWFNSFILNYGWTIILFTIVVKIVLLPLDFMQRKVGLNNAMAQAKLNPELNKIKEKYANNPEKMREKLNQKQAEFMRSGEMKLGSTCTVMLVYLVATLVIFVSLFYSMQAIGNVQSVNTYIELENRYEQVLEETGDQGVAQNAVLELYNSGEVTESWLWVDNIWRSDTSTGVVPTFDEFKSISQSVAESPFTFDGENALTADKYNAVMSKIVESTQGKWNGYYILIILCGLVSFFSFYLTSSMNGAGQKQKGQNAGFAGAMKFIMPAIMILITLFYSAAFALYIFASSLFALCSTPIFNAILTKMKKKAETGNLSAGAKKDSIDVDYRINKITKVDE